MRSNKVEFQVGVDVLGFPIIVTHTIPDRTVSGAFNNLNRATDNFKKALYQALLPTSAKIARAFASFNK